MAEFGRQGSAPSYQPGVEWCSNNGQYAQYNNSAPPYSGFQSNNMFQNNSNSFDDEPPLLEELGIDVSAIVKKVKAILLLKLDSSTLEDLDLGGALIFVLVLGGLHLLMGKLHVGIILGWSVIQSMVLWVLFNQIVGSSESPYRLDLYGCCCIVGYGVLPLLVHGFIALFIPKGFVSSILAGFCAIWAAITASRVFIRRCPSLEKIRPLVISPCLLLYASIALLAVY